LYLQLLTSLLHFNALNSNSPILSESETNAKGILREVWDTGKENESPDTLQEYNVFGLQSRFWNLIQLMDAPANFGNNYAQKLTAYLKVKSRLL